MELNILNVFRMLILHLNYYMNPLAYLGSCETSYMESFNSFMTEAVIV